MNDEKNIEKNKAFSVCYIEKDVCRIDKYLFLLYWGDSRYNGEKGVTL